MSRRKKKALSRQVPQPDCQVEQSGKWAYVTVGVVALTYGSCVVAALAHQDPPDHYSDVEVRNMLLLAVMLMLTGFGLIGLQVGIRHKGLIDLQVWIRQKVRAVVAVTAVLLAVKAALAFTWHRPPPSQGAGSHLRGLDDIARWVSVGIPNATFALILAVTAARMGRQRSGGRLQVSPKADGPETAGDSTRLPGCSGPILGAILVHPLVFALGYLYGSLFGCAGPSSGIGPSSYVAEGGANGILHLLEFYDEVILISLSAVGGIVGAVVEFGLRSDAHRSRSRGKSPSAAPGPAADRPPD